MSALTNKDMSLFDDMLHSDQTLFRDHVPLDYDYLPKMLPYREKEQKYIAQCIRPLFQKRNGKNILLYGQPGIGKTAAVRHILRELDEKTDDLFPIYINCWQKNTSFKIVLEICTILGYKFTHNKKTDDLFNIVRDIINKHSAVFCFDEVDKAEDLDFLYFILEQVYRKTILLITNYKSWIQGMDNRIISRLTPEMMEFRSYDTKEIRGILKQRLQYAFVPGCWMDEAFNKVVQTTAQIEDVRTGLYLLKEAGNEAEGDSSRKIKLKHVCAAIDKLNYFSIKKKEELKQDEQDILELVKSHSGKKIGDLYKIYKEDGGNGVYKTFQRKIDFLEKNKFISVDKTQGGKKGNTSIVRFEQTKLDEY